MPTIALAPSGKEIPCAPGETVLAALEHAGYALPNNCRAGACGECKVRVLEGTFDQGTVLDMALEPAERAAGYGLMCMAKPLSDRLVIDWGAADARPTLFPPREGQRYVVVERLLRTPAVLALHLRPVGAPMRYWPGQYVLLGDADAGAPPRCYSIANAPRPDGEIVLHVTRVKGGATSPWIHDRLAEGAVVAVSGPYGTFIGDPSAEVPVVCMAAGSGLAPIRCLAEAALRRGYRPRVTLLHAGRTAADLYDRGLMAYWETKHRTFTYRPVLSREDVAGMLHGRIPALLPGLFPDLSRHGVYIAGPPAFTEDCAAAARALGATRVYTEGFVAQGPS